MALPKRIVRQIRSGTYRPSGLGKKAREAARARQTPPPEPPQRVSFYSVKKRMKTKKHIVFRENFGYTPSRSMENVDESGAYDEMSAALGFTNDEMEEYASRAAKAWHLLDTTGDAGNMAIYLAYDFLWYH